MKTRMQTDIWIYYTALALGLILLMSVAGVTISMLMKHTLPGILVALGFVAATGLGKLWISPLK